MRSVEYANVKQQRTVDGGYSGPLIVTCADGKKGMAPLVFVDGDWLPTNLVLSCSEAESQQCASGRSAGRRGGHRVWPGHPPQPEDRPRFLTEADGASRATSHGATARATSRGAPRGLPVDDCG